jgi:hypothetical protein
LILLIIQLIFGYYYDENGEYCEDIIRDDRYINTTEYVSLMKEQLLKYNIDITKFTNCSFINSYRTTISKMESIKSINYCINTYINSKDLNNKLDRTKNNLLIFNPNVSFVRFKENFYIDDKDNIYYLKYDSENSKYVETNDKVNEIELRFYNIDFTDSFNLTSSEFIEFLIKYLNINNKYNNDTNILYELKDQYLTEDNSKFYFTNIPLQYYTFKSFKTKE